MRLTFLLLACGTAMSAAESATVSIELDRPGARIPADFLGISYEKNALVEPHFTPANTTLINLHRNLGAGTLRLGGNKVELTRWEAGAAATLDKSTGLAVIGRATLDDLYGFLKTTGWRCLHGLNLASNQPAASADEAAYALKVGATSVLAFEIGNEPNLYPKGPKREGIRPGNWGYPQYQAEFAATADAIVAKRPLAPLTGPAVTKSTKWMPLFLADFKSRVVLATSHVYPLSAPETDPQAQRFASIEKLLGEKYLDDWAVKLADAQAVGVPYRVAECNTASGGGKRGVSNAFASALWSVDFLFDVATRGGQGVNLHGSFTPNNYSPIVYDKKTETYGAAPLYYGLLFFSQAAQGRLVASETKCAANFVAHAVRGSDGKLRVTLLNKDLAQPVAAQLDLGAAFKTGHVLRLTAPSVDATAGVTFAGAAVTAEGKWTPQGTEPLTLTAGKATVTLPPASAALLIAE